MKSVPPDHPISPVGTHAGDRTSKKTVPGAFEVPGSLSVTHSARSQVRDHFAARRRPAEKPDKLEARGRKGLEPMTGKMQVKKELAARRTTRPLVGLRRRLASARSLSDPRPPTPRTDTGAIPVPQNCGGAAAAASRTSPRLKLRQ